MRHISVRRAGFESQIYDHTPHVLMSTELSSVHVSILTGGGTHRSRCCAEAGSAARIWILAKSSPELRLSRYLTFFSFTRHDPLHSLTLVKPARLSGSFHAYLCHYVTLHGQAFTDHGTYVCTPRVRIPVRLKHQVPVILSCNESVTRSHHTALGPSPRFETTAPIHRDVVLPVVPVYKQAPCLPPGHPTSDFH